MSLYAITHPVATLARGIENIALSGQNSDNFYYRSFCKVSNRAIALTVFPIFLLISLTFYRVPKLLLSITNKEKFEKNFDKIVKFSLGIYFSHLAALHTPESVAGFFLKDPRSDMVAPFGVETQYGKVVDHIYYPSNAKELQNLIKEAIKGKKQISVIGAGMSQGSQTVPKDSHQVVINTKYLNYVQIAEDGKTVTAGAGATWEQVQLALPPTKSVIVKQASDLFSIGGSIGINCHGWAHEKGALSSTVKALTVIDANGDIRKLTPEDELFGCFFGTLGYFGVILDATFEIADNEHLIQKTEVVPIDQFVERYKTNIKGKDIPLFGGRLTLDSTDGNPLREAYMVRYEKDPTNTAPLDNIKSEPAYGTRIHRIALKLFSHLSNFSVKRFIKHLWQKERTDMLQETKITFKEALHPPINAFKMLHRSNMHTQWLQEYFIKGDNLAEFLKYLGKTLKDNKVRLINATIRPTPKDTVSVLPYAEQDRYAVVLCFAQVKTKSKIAQTKKWINQVNDYAISRGDVYYQAYMPFTSQGQFEKCYGKERVENMRRLKEKYDPNHIFSNEHTAKYFNKKVKL